MSTKLLKQLLLITLGTAIMAFGIINFAVVACAIEFDFTDTEFSGQFLQFAILILGTGQTGLRVITEHQFQNGTAGIQSTLTVGVDNHTFHDRSGTRRSKIAAAFDLDHANTAAGRLVGDAATEFVAVAESRDVDIQLFGGVQNGGAGGNGYRFTVDCKIYSVHLYTHPLTIAFFGQPSIQAPHLMHLLASIT